MKLINYLSYTSKFCLLPIVFFLNAFVLVCSTHGVSWDGSIGTTYPGGVIYGGVQTVNDTNVYVSDGATVYSWNSAAGWNSLTDLVTTAMSCQKFLATSNFLYTFGLGTRSDGGHLGVFRWNYSTLTWSQLGPDASNMDGSVLAMGLGADNYLYFGGQWAAGTNTTGGSTLPGHLPVNGIFRFGPLSAGSYDNMLGGLSMVTSDLEGVYAIATDNDSVPDVRTIVYIGGQFLCTNNQEGVTSHNLAVWESSSSFGQKYRAVHRDNDSTGPYGVSFWEFSCSENQWLFSDNGVFIKKIMALPQGTTNAIIAAGRFELTTSGPDGNCTPVGVGSAGYNGLMKIVHEFRAHPNQEPYITKQWPVAGPLYSCDISTCANCGAPQMFQNVSFADTNVFVVGQFDHWGSFCATSGSSLDQLFGMSDTNGVESYVSTTALSIYDPNPIYAVSSSPTATSVYVGGAFYQIGGVSANFIAKFTP